ncbi:DUF4430 domain-containing protein [Secundilactobacillus yichangensis]|uniref:DUF4430 domain-containing protein n=1 Tax=Secundilactobacillus yichangensis TaxID=2799580 RepID=UPI0019419C71|nr:DUF4430 domain-containing protein [Secundilactobacillus yichangensis]
MSKRKITMIVLSLLVIFGLGFAGYSAMSGGNKSANNSYGNDKASVNSTSKAPAKSASSASASATQKPEKSANGQAKSGTAALKDKDQGGKATKGNTAQLKATASKKGHKKGHGVNAMAKATPSAHHLSGGQTCSLTVRGPISKGNKVLLQDSRVRIKKGETVATVLKKVAGQKHVAVAYQGGSGSTYVRGIAGLFEFDHGSGSGWLYSVNNKFYGYSAGKKKVKAGDRVQWLYTENLGKDRHSPVASQH